MGIACGIAIVGHLENGVGLKAKRFTAQSLLLASGLMLTGATSHEKVSASASSSSGEVFAHMSAAKLAAGKDFSGIATILCLPDEPHIVRSNVARPQEPKSKWYASPHKVFDNLYWLGTREHSAWALETSDGIILIDSNFEWAFEDVLVQGMEKLGLDPSEIKYVLISHAHGDHDQWAGLLQKNYGTKVVMGEEDWKLTTTRPVSTPGGVPEKDISVGLEGRTLTLGDTSVRIVATPGHTRGTLSYLFEVTDHGQSVTVAYSGGTATGLLGTNAGRWDEYIASQVQFAEIAKAAGASVILSNHSQFDDAYTKARLGGARQEVGEENHFIVGSDAVSRYFSVMIECAKASKLRIMTR